MKSRTLSLFLTVLLILGLGSAAQAAVTEGIELTVWGHLRTITESHDNNRFTDFYEDLTGIHVNWILYVDDVPTQFNLSFVSGDYPDVYLMNAFSAAQILQAIEAGAIVPIDDYLAQYAPNYSKLLELDPDLRAAMTAPDGHIYSFPNFNSLTGYTTSHKLWLYEPWLKASGLPMPTTLDELKELLIYYRDHDMNGNGDPHDEAPIMGSTLILSNATDPVVAIIDCFEVITDNWLRADAEGNISTMATTDNYRAGLSYANALFEEGLLAEETYVQDLNTFRTINSVASSDQVIVGVAGGPLFARFITAASPNRYKDWTWIPPLKKDADSEPQTILQPPPYNMKSMITVACEHPEAAVKWLDMALDPLIQVMNDYGFEDEHWTRISESEETGIVFQLTDKSLYAEGASTQNVVWADNWTIPWYRGPLYVPFTQQYEEGTDAYYMGMKEDAANKAYEAVAAPSGIPVGNIWNTDMDLAAEVAEYAMTIDEYIKTSYAEFITGVRDVDDDAVWQGYLNELSAMGLEHYLAICEQYYFGK